MMADTTTTTQGNAADADPVTARALRVLEAEHGGCVVASELAGAHPWIQLTPDGLVEAMTTLRDADETQLDCCHLVSSADWPGKGADAGEIEVVYHLCSFARREEPDYAQRADKNDPWVAIKVRVPRDRPELPSVMGVWTGADWHEREVFDLMGVIFTGRDDLVRILLPEDWPGHPLRKDWVYPAEYHGIPIIPPEDQEQ